MFLATGTVDDDHTGGASHAAPLPLPFQLNCMPSQLQFCL
jgi:hypothetical protein